jgi:hypothetical protein
MEATRTQISFLYHWSEINPVTKLHGMELQLCDGTCLHGGWSVSIMRTMGGFRIVCRSVGIVRPMRGFRIVCRSVGIVRTMSRFCTRSWCRRQCSRNIAR